MDITPAAVRSLRATFSKAFRDAYDVTDVFYTDLTTRIPSTGPQNTYGWMAQLPSVREWVGPRVFENLKTHSYSLVNKEWESSFSVPRADMEDDNLGTYENLSAAHGEAMRKHPDSLLVSILKAGHSNLCFDGQNFFDTDHPVAPFDSSQGTYSNYLVSTALTAANYEIARATMMEYKGDAGRNLNVVPNLLVVPPRLEATAKTLVQLSKNAAGADNPNYGTATVKVIPELAGTSTENATWYLMATQRRIRPFVFQPRRPTTFVMKNDPNDDRVAYDRQFDFMADARYAMGYTLPFLALKAQAAA